jgi:hypothetical protein
MRIPDFYRDHFCNWALLQRIEDDSEISQAALVEALRISIGTVNGRLR